MKPEQLVTYRAISLLERAKNRIEDIVSKIPSPVAVIDIDGNIYKGNTKLSSMFHTRTEDLISQNLSELLSRENWEMFKGKLEKLKVMDEKYSFRTQLEKVDEKLKYPVHCYWDVHIYDRLPGGTLLYLVVGSDITKLVKEKEELQKENANLLETVNQRTEQLETARQQLVLHADETGKTEAIAGILHVIEGVVSTVVKEIEELSEGNKNTNTLSLLLQLTQQAAGEIEAFKEHNQIPTSIEKIPLSLDNISADLTTENMKTRELISKIREQALFLENFIDIKERQNEEHLPIIKAPLLPVIRKSFDFFKTIMEQHKIEHELHISEEVTAVFNRDKLKYVVNQLIENAIESFKSTTPNKHIKVHLESCKKHHSICFTNNGAPIHETLVPKIFKCGYTSGDEEKLGLGLHQSLNFMNEMGGSLELKESTKKSTSFIVKVNKGSD